MVLIVSFNKKMSRSGAGTMPPTAICQAALPLNRGFQNEIDRHQAGSIGDFDVRTRRTDAT
nr:hypothetical protein [uncultured Cupriavidus sp.]